MPSLEQIAELVPDDQWSDTLVDVRGKQVPRLLWELPVLWYEVRPDQPLLLLIVRDPAGKQPDDFLFSTDLAMAPETVASTYASRWSIEDTNRNLKQHLGGEDPRYGRDEIVFNPAFLAFAEHWGFEPIAAAQGRGQTKGKVESGVKYVKKNCLAGQEPETLPEAQGHGRWWRDTVRQGRHRTCARDRPAVHDDRTGVDPIAGVHYSRQRGQQLRVPPVRWAR